MGEIKRLLGKRSIIAITIILIIDILSFIVIQPKTDEQQWYKDKLDYLENYPATIDKVLQNAEQMLTIDIFGDSAGYSHNNILKTVEDYSRVDNLQLEFDNDKATEAVLNYQYIIILVFVVMLYILYGICQERTNGMLALTYSAYGGRKKLALKRGVFFLTAPFIMTILLYCVNLLLACAMYGIDDFTGPIQTISAYSQYTYLHSKGIYLIINVLRSAFMSSVLTTLAYMICNLFANVNFSLFIIGAILGGEWWLAVNIPNASVLENLRYINVYKLFEGGIIYKSYANTDIFGQCISSASLVFWFSFVLLIVTFIVAIIAYKKRESKIPSIIKNIISFIERGEQKILEKLSFIFKELWKILLIKKCIILIIAGTWLFIFVWQHTLITFPQRYEEMDLIYEQYGGADWSDFEQYVTDFTAEIDKYSLESQAIVEQIKAGTLSSDNIMEVTRLESRVNVGTKKLEEYNSKIELKNKLKEEKNIDVYVMSDRGYHEAIGHNSTIRECVYAVILLILAILTASLSFELESESGVMQIFSASGKGTRWLYSKKYISLIMLITLSYIVAYAADWLLLINTYNLKHLNAPIQSLSFFADININISIIQYIIILLILKFVYILIIQAATIVIAAGKKVRNRSYILMLMIASIIGYVVLMRLSVIMWILLIIVGFPVYVLLVKIAGKRFSL